MEVVALAEKRGRGRPKGTQEPGIRVSTWISTAEFDRLHRLAEKRRSSVSKTIRSIVAGRLSQRA